MENKFIDAHLHLQDDRVISDADQMIEHAVARGVSSLFCNATSEADWQKVLKLAQDHQQIVPFLGVHPWQANTVKGDWQERLAEALGNTGAGVGEIGLDKMVKDETSVQEQVFIDQLQIAKQLKKPVTIHCIGKWGVLLELLEEFDMGLSGIIIHSFGGSKEVMFRLLDLGAYVSFSTMLADPVRKKMQQAFLAAPLDRLLLETDSPDQYCHALMGGASGVGGHYRDELNEPALIPRLYEFSAKLKKVDLDKFCETILKNGQIFTN